MKGLERLIFYSVLVFLLASFLPNLCWVEDGSVEPPVEWKTIISDKANGEGDETISSQHRSAPDLVSLECAHAGGNRVRWRLTFAEPYVGQDTVLIVYLDVDADEATGRVGKWVQGTDRMLVLVNGETKSTVKSHAGEGRRTKGHVHGKWVVFEDDLWLLAERIRNAYPEKCPPFEWNFRVRVLSHTVANPQDQDGTVWASGKLPIDPARGRPREAKRKEDSLVQDLAVWRSSERVAEIRFTTNQPTEARMEGPGDAVCHGGDGLRQNHAWSIHGIAGNGDTEERIVLYDDLLERMDEMRLRIGEWKADQEEQLEEGRIEVFLNVDGESLAERGESSVSVRWPVSGGIPFPKGRLFSSDYVRLLDSEGTERESQVETLSVWPDRSVRWLLVEFFVDLPRELESSFSLEYGPRARRKISSVGEAVTLPRWSEVLSWPGGTLSAAEDDDKGTLERGGPVHRILAYEGGYRSEGTASPFYRRVRVHGFPGLPFARIEHTVLVQAEGLSADLESLRLGFALDAASGGTVPQASAEALYFGQVTRDESETGTVGQRRRGDRKLQGFVSRENGRGKTLVAVRRFAENWPKALIADETHLFVDLFPPLAPDEYSDRPEPGERLYYWFVDGRYRLKRGVQKTHEILWAHFSPGQNGPNDEALAYWFNNPPVLRASPEWVALTEAAGDFQPCVEERFPEYERRVREGFQSVEERRGTLQEYGFLNFGDWFGERGKNWGNLEYDLAHTLWLQWQRCGDYAYYRRAEEAAMHIGDVDVVHHDPSPMNVGRMWGHSVGHTGGYFPEGSLEMEPIFLRGFWDLGHTWCEGMLNCYLATGELRFKENGMLVADQLARYATVDYRMGTERTAGWPIIALVAAYETTGDPYYLNGAKIVARQALREQDPERGVWSHRIGECKHDPVHYGGKPFMTGVLLTGLSRLHRNLPVETEEDGSFRDAVATSILKGSDWMLNEAWVEEGGGFIYAQCSSFEGKVSHAGAWMACEALAYATEISGDPKYIEKARISVATALETDPPSWGKALAMETRFMPYFLAALADRGLDSIRAASKEEQNQ